MEAQKRLLSTDSASRTKSHEINLQVQDAKRQLQSYLYHVDGLHAYLAVQVQERLRDRCMLWSRPHVHRGGHAAVYAFHCLNWFVMRRMTVGACSRSRQAE